MPIDPGNTALVLICTALALLMTPGLAMFWAGMVRAKSSLAILMQVFTCIGVVSVTWLLAGYSLAFGPDLGGGLLNDLHFPPGRTGPRPCPACHSRHRPCCSPPSR